MTVDSHQKKREESQGAYQMTTFPICHSYKKRVIMCVFSLKKYFSFLTNVIDWIIVISGQHAIYEHMNSVK